MLVIHYLLGLYTTWKHLLAARPRIANLLGFCPFDGLGFLKLGSATGHSIQDYLGNNTFRTLSGNNTFRTLS